MDGQPLVYNKFLKGHEICIGHVVVVKEALDFLYITSGNRNGLDFVSIVNISFQRLCLKINNYTWKVSSHQFSSLLKGIPVCCHRSIVLQINLLKRQLYIVFLFRVSVPAPW